MSHPDFLLYLEVSLEHVNLSQKGERCLLEEHTKVSWGLQGKLSSVTNPMPYLLAMSRRHTFVTCSLICLALVKQVSGAGKEHPSRNFKLRSLGSRGHQD